jgi:hypothetical protein
VFAKASHHRDRVVPASTPVRDEQLVGGRRWPPFHAAHPERCAVCRAQAVQPEATPRGGLDRAAVAQLAAGTSTRSRWVPGASSRVPVGRVVVSSPEPPKRLRLEHHGRCDRVATPAPRCPDGQREAGVPMPMPCSCGRSPSAEADAEPPLRGCRSRQPRRTFSTRLCARRRAGADTRVPRYAVWFVHHRRGLRGAVGGRERPLGAVPRGDRIPWLPAPKSHGPRSPSLVARCFTGIGRRGRDSVEPSTPFDDPEGSSLVVSRSGKPLTRSRAPRSRWPWPSTPKGFRPWPPTPRDRRPQPSTPKGLRPQPRVPRNR